MTARWRRMAFWLTALSALAPLILPLSTDTPAALSARLGPLVAVLVEALTLGLAPLWATATAALGLIGTASGCIATLVLVSDVDIAGSAGLGIWLLTLATWLGAALTLSNLAGLRMPAGPVRRAQEVAEAAKIVLAADTTGAQTLHHQEQMMGEIAKLLDPGNGELDPKDYERTVSVLLSGGSDPVITKKPEGAWTHAVYEAMK